MIYLDHHATTPCDPRVVAAMLPYFTGLFGNPSSAHAAGERTARAVEEAREQVAALVGARPGEVIFTSGATEANNLALLGYARAQREREPARRRIVVSAIEHKAVTKPAAQLVREGFEVVVLPVDATGTVRLDAAADLITDNTLLVAVQAANGEVGTIQPIRELAALAHRHGARLLCDAAQAVGKIPVNVLAWDVDFLTISGHKLYGPQGVGALVVRNPRRTALEPLTYGGGHERGWRAGTLNVPGIVGLGAACALAAAEMAADAHRLSALRDLLEADLLAALPGARVNGNRAHRLPHNLSLTLPGVETEALLARLPEIALSTGSACDSGTLEPSPTLLALGMSREDARATVRVGLGRGTTGEDAARVAEMVVDEVGRMQELA